MTPIQTPNIWHWSDAGEELTDVADDRCYTRQPDAHGRSRKCAKAQEVDDHLTATELKPGFVFQGEPLPAPPQKKEGPGSLRGPQPCRVTSAPNSIGFQLLSYLSLLSNVWLDALADRQQHTRKRYGSPLAR